MNRANADAMIAVTASQTMDLAGKYDKLNLLGDGEVQVWRGRERSRGTPVLLHTFTGSPNLLRLAAQYLLNRPPGSPLLDIGEWEGATCLVTVSELDLLDIGAWLQNAVASGPIAAPPPPPVPAAPPPMPAVADAVTQRVNTTGPVAIPRADSVPVAKPAASPGPGEFTRAFQLPGSNPPPQPLQDPMASSGPAKPAAGPGEFTRMFQLPSQAGNRETSKVTEIGLPPSPPPPPEIHPPAAPPSAGEFTRLFKAQPNDNAPKDFSVSGGTPQPTFRSPELPAEPVAPKLGIATGPVPLPERSAPPVPKGPGEYTRMIQTQPLQATAPQPSVSPSPASAQAVQLPIAVSVTPPAIPSVPAPPALPSVSVPSVPSVPSIPSAPASIPAPSGQRSGISPVVLLLGGLILVAVILVLIFALRR